MTFLKWLFELDMVIMSSSVMYFGLNNVVEFMYFMNKVFKQYHNMFLIAFIYDILIYSSVRMHMLRIWGLCCKLSNVKNYMLRLVSVSFYCGPLLSKSILYLVKAFKLIIRKPRGLRVVLYLFIYGVSWISPVTIEVLWKIFSLLLRLWWNWLKRTSMIGRVWEEILGIER